MRSTTIKSLRRRRSIAMGLAVGACVLGVMLQLWLFYGSAPSWLDAALLPNLLVSGVLGTITTILVVILGVWVPAHDRIIRALRVKEEREYLPATEDSFVLGPVWHTTPPPRHHLH